MVVVMVVVVVVVCFPCWVKDEFIVVVSEDEDDAHEQFPWQTSADGAKYLCSGIK